MTRAERFVATAARSSLVDDHPLEQEAVSRLYQVALRGNCSSVFAAIAAARRHRCIHRYTFPPNGKSCSAEVRLLDGSASSTHSTSYAIISWRMLYGGLYGLCCAKKDRDIRKPWMRAWDIPPPLLSGRCFPVQGMLERFPCVATGVHGATSVRLHRLTVHLVLGLEHCRIKIATSRTLPDERTRDDSRAHLSRPLPAYPV